ncbi:MAG: Diaminopimelate epimerase [Pseudomonadota bacterium]
MEFFRAHGLGNDYLVWVATPDAAPPTPAQVRLVCDRHRGVGGDGVLVPVDAPDGGYGVRILNPDGSEAEKSGNGLRILAWWLHHRRGAPESFAVWTRGGTVRCVVEGARVRVDMGRAIVGAVERRGAHAVIPVDVGNPHAVVRVDAEPSRADWHGAGAWLEQSVPGRTNVQFVWLQAGAVHARVWERGAGPTLASGSSACAVAAALVAQGAVASPVTVRMEGGDLHVDVHADGSVRLEGPVAPVGSVRLDPGFAATLAAYP